MIDFDKKRAEEKAHTKAAVKVALGIIWAAGGRTEVFSAHEHPELQDEIKKTFKKHMPKAIAEEMSKLGYT